MGEEYIQYDQLEFILQELSSYPLAGTDLMRTGLRSPLYRNRYRALANLQSWVEDKKMPLNQLSPELCAIVRELRDKEIKEDDLEMINALLDGQTRFTENDEEV